MVPLTAIIVRDMTQRHKYRWHVTTEKYINVSIKDLQIFLLSINFR